MGATAKPIRRPRLACEVAADRVIAARASERRRRLEFYTAHSLPPGVVAPSLGEQNVLDAHALHLAVSEALAAVRGRSRDVVVVLPDAAVRVVMLDFDTLPEKEPEAAAVVRFRLKKSLPFNVDHAALSFDSRPVNGGLRVVAAVSPQNVIQEYETVFREAGYNPGVVLPSMLASLGAVETDGPTLVVKVDAGNVSLAIVDNGELRLLRTLENPSGAEITGTQIAGDIYPSIVFYEDNYGARVERVLLAGLPSVAELAPALDTQVGLPVEALVGGRYLEGNLTGGSTHPWLLAGVLGALVG